MSLINTDNNISLILPAYKESKNLHLLLLEISNINIINTFNIYIIEDKSDEQFNLSEFNYNLKIKHIIRTKYPKSISASVIDSIDYIRTKYMLIMDSDLQHNPNDILKFIKILKENNSDIIIGSRNLELIYKSMKKHRVLISKLGCYVCNLFINKKLSDPLTGFFLVKTNHLNKIKNKLHYSGSKILFNILLNSQNVKIDEVIIDFRKRQNGKSKFDIYWIFNFIKLLLFR
tara:strand:+ start:2307 stop:2999 length:693 start_codon:yes stop_codon:yes gene_type:complete